MSMLEKDTRVTPLATALGDKAVSDEEQVRHRRWYEWYEPGTSKEEKKLLMKLDWSILLFISLSFFIKYLDQSNVTNAYVSGMRGDLHLESNQLNWFTTYYNLGIVIGAPLVTLTLTKVPPGMVLSTCILITSLFVLFIYKANSAETVYALRFFAGLFSAGVLPGAFFIIGSWYRKNEIARRSVLSMISFYAGSMFSAYIQAGLHAGMNGRLGLAAWRWLFIFDAILGIPVAVLGFAFCPDAPLGRKSWWMSQGERELAIKRIERDGQIERDPFQFPATVIQVLKTWQFWTFPVTYAFLFLTCGVLVPQWMTLYLDSTKMYSVSNVNAIPTTVSCAIIVLIVITGNVVDYIRNYPAVLLGLSLAMIYAFAVFEAWPASNAFKISTYIILGASWGAQVPLQTAWANTSCGGDKYLRAATTAMMSTYGYLGETFAQQYFFPTRGAPSYAKSHGFLWGLCWAIATLVWSCGLTTLCERYFDSRRRALRHEA